VSFLPLPPGLSALVRGAGVSLATLSAAVHRGSVANAQNALFERRRDDLDALRAWRDLEPRLHTPASPSSLSR
jgi:hypothetical protein